MGKFDFLCRFMSASGRKVPIVPLQQFNKAGNRILTREVLPAKDSLFRKLDAPFTTTSAEKLVVERNFGKESTEIITFRNEHGEVIGRSRKNFVGGELTDSSSSRYFIAPKNYVESDTGNYILSVGDKQTQFFDAQGKLKSMDRIRTDFVKFENEPNSHLTQMRYRSNLNQDGNFDGKFSIYHKYGNEVTNDLRINTTHSERGKLLNQEVETAQNINEKVLRDPYLITRGMTDEFAIKNIADRFNRIHGIENRDYRIYYIKGDDLNYVGGLVNSQDAAGFGLLPSMVENVDTVAHELRHLRQYEIQNEFLKQLRYKLTFSKKYNPHKYKVAKHFTIARFTGNPFPSGTNENSFFFKWYRKHGLEPDAYRQGERFRKDYIRRTEEFRKNFPFISRYNRGEENLRNIYE